jgi:hypothetical protein
MRRDETRRDVNNLLQCDEVTRCGSVRVMYFLANLPLDLQGLHSLTSSISSLALVSRLVSFSSLSLRHSLSFSRSLLFFRSHSLGFSLFSHSLF